MKTQIPSMDDVRAALAPLGVKHVARLAALSNVPQSTIYKIKLKATKNPGIETVRRLMPHIAAALREAK